MNYLTQGVNGTVVTPTTISVGAGELSTDDTAQGLINAINSCGLGLTASFTTGKGSGQTPPARRRYRHRDHAEPGAGVGNGTTPGLVGTLTIPDASRNHGRLSGTLTIKGSDGSTSVINLATGDDDGSYDQATLITAINNGGYGDHGGAAGAGN